MDAKGKICMLNGAQEFKDFAAELVRVYHAARRRHQELEMPTLIMVTGDGFGNTTYLHLLAELMKEEHLLSFSGEEEVFEWRMLQEDEQAVTRLLIRMDRAAGFYPYFSGVIGLDLSDYKEFRDLPETLFELIRENRKKTLFCLMITEKQASGFLPLMKEKLQKYTRVRTIRLMADAKEYCCFVRDEFRRRGFLMEKGMDETIRAFVTVESENGYRGLQLAIDEVIWNKMNNNDGLLIETGDLAVARKEKHEPGRKKNGQRMIGFGACEP